MDQELLDKFKPDEISEDYRICNKCGRKIYFGTNLSFYSTVKDNGERIMHCLDCGPITNKEKEKKEMTKDNVNSPSHYTDGKLK